MKLDASIINVWAKHIDSNYSYKTRNTLGGILYAKQRITEENGASTIADDLSSLADQEVKRILRAAKASGQDITDQFRRPQTRLVAQARLSELITEVNNEA